MSMRSQGTHSVGTWPEVQSMALEFCHTCVCLLYMEEGIKSRTPQSIYIEHGVWEAFVCGNLTNGRALRNAAD